MRTGITAAVCVVLTTLGATPVWSAPPASRLGNRGVAAGPSGSVQSAPRSARPLRAYRGSTPRRTQTAPAQPSRGFHGHSHRGHTHGGYHGPTHGHHHLGHRHFRSGGFASPFFYGSSGYYSPYSYYFAPSRIDVFGGFDVYVRPGEYIGYGIPPEAVGIYAPYQVIPPTGWGGAGSEVFNNEAIRDTLEENAQRWEQPLNVEPLPERAVRRPQPSTPDAKLRSIRLQSRGDYWMQKQEYARAYQRYTQAGEAAADRPEVYFRKAFALVALNHTARAVQEIKRGLELDPTWPTHGASLSEIYGRDNELAKMSFLDRVADWVRADIRDPDRLFLMGVLLYFDDVRDKAMPFFEAAWRLSGGADHLRAFLAPTPVDDSVRDNIGAEPDVGAGPTDVGAGDNPPETEQTDAVDASGERRADDPKDSSPADGPRLISPMP